MDGRVLCWLGNNGEPPWVRAVQEVLGPRLAGARCSVCSDCEGMGAPHEALRLLSLTGTLGGYSHLMSSDPSPAGVRRPCVMRPDGIRMGSSDTCPYCQAAQASTINTSYPPCHKCRLDNIRCELDVVARAWFRAHHAAPQLLFDDMTKRDWGTSLSRAGYVQKS